MASLLAKFTKKITDCSTLNSFQYIFYCDQCGRPWKSRPIRYKKDPSVLENQSYAWNSAYEEAFRAATMKGMFYFNLCKKCNRWVCHEHFNSQKQRCLECSQKGE